MTRRAEGRPEVRPGVRARQARPPSRTFAADTVPHFLCAGAGLTDLAEAAMLEGGAEATKSDRAAREEEVCANAPARSSAHP